MARRQPCDGCSRDVRADSLKHANGMELCAQCRDAVGVVSLD